MNNTNQIRARLKVALPLIREASQISTMIVENARLLLDEAEREELQKIAQEIGAYNATVETNLAQFGRLGFNGKKFVVLREKIQ